MQGPRLQEPKCVSEGTCYPANHVGGVIDLRAEAQAAAEELRTAGFTDVHEFHGQDAYSAIQEASQHVNAIARMWRGVRNRADEGDVYRGYLECLQSGCSVLFAYAPSIQQARSASQILVRHHAHDIWYLGPWTFEPLTDSWLREQAVPNTNP